MKQWINSQVLICHFVAITTTCWYQFNLRQSLDVIVTALLCNKKKIGYYYLPLLESFESLILDLMQIRQSIIVAFDVWCMINPHPWNICPSHFHSLRKCWHDYSCLYDFIPYWIRSNKFSFYIYIRHRTYLKYKCYSGVHYSLLKFCIILSFINKLKSNKLIYFQKDMTEKSL